MIYQLAGSIVFVMAESKAIEGEYVKKGNPQNIRFRNMQVIPDLKAETITSAVEKGIPGNAALVTDNLTSYFKLIEVVEKHQPQVIPKYFGEALLDKLLFASIARKNEFRYN